MRLLDGRELAGFIEERQARQVRAMRQSNNVFPKLAIIQIGDDPVISKYVALKQTYGDEILVDVEVHAIGQDELMATIEHLNVDDTVHGIIIQLPLQDPSQTDEAVNAVAPEKDVDGLGKASIYTTATPLAIDWLLAGYNVDLRNKNIAIVGNGRLVGSPLAHRWTGNNYDVSVYDVETEDLADKLRGASVIVSATGSPGLITSDMIQPGAVVVDAGTASENGHIVGDVDEKVRQRDDLMLTPAVGGVGPLTVTALFDNVIQAAQATIKS